MATPVVTVASGGLPVVDVTAGIARGIPVSEAPPGRGTAVTKVAVGGMPVVYAVDSGGGGGGGGFSTWDVATVSGASLSNGNLTITSSSGSDSGAHVVSTSGKTSGKYYFEITTTTHTGGADTGFGVGTPTSSYVSMGSSASVGVLMYTGTGSIWANGGSSGFAIGATSNGNVIGVAADLDNRRVWFRKVSGAPGNWNGSGTADPAANIGGVAVPAGTMIPWNNFNNAGSVYTANFGASAFSGAVPVGFTSGWTV